MAAKEDKSTSQCTHRGDFPIPILDSSTFYTPMYYNERASDSILSPEAICYASKGLLKRWLQSGSPEETTGKVSFYTGTGAEVISLMLNKRNGLYYTPISAVAVTNDTTSHTANSCLNEVLYYHTRQKAWMMMIYQLMSTMDGVNLTKTGLPTLTHAHVSEDHQHRDHACHQCQCLPLNLLNLCSIQNINKWKQTYGKPVLVIAVNGNSKSSPCQPPELHRSWCLTPLFHTMCTTKLGFGSVLQLEANTHLAPPQLYNDGTWILVSYVLLRLTTLDQIKPKIESSLHTMVSTPTSWSSTSQPSTRGSISVNPKSHLSA
jgi:hypothetical protein